MTGAVIAGELLGIILTLAKSSSASEAADIKRQLDSTAEQLAAIPALGPEVGALAEQRRRELRGRDTIPGISPGRVAFEAYTTKRGGRNHDGTPTPAWDALTDGVRDGWEAAASAARESL